MATGSEDFSGFIVGDSLIGLGWTVFRDAVTGTGAHIWEVENNADMPGGRQVHTLQPNSGTWSGALLTAAGTAADWETLTLTRRTGGNGQFTGQIHRAQSGSAYSAHLTHNDSDHRVVRLVTAADADLATVAHGITPTNWFWRRARVSGSVIQTRVWAADLLAGDLGLGDEPATWGIDHTDTSPLTVDGGVGLIVRGRFGGDDSYWGYFGWATDGDSAPGPSAGGSGRTGDGAVTLGGLEVAGAGSVPRTGDGALTLGAITVAGAGSAPAITGAGAVTLGSLSAAGAGSVPVAGAGVVTLGAIAAAGAGTVPVAGTGAVTLGALAIAGAASTSRTGAGAVTLGAIAATGASALSTISGAGAVTLGPLTAAGAGAVAVAGTGGITLGSLAAAGAGRTLVRGSAAVTLGAIDVVGAGVVPVAGAGEIMLGSLQVAGAGSLAIVGAGALTLGAIYVSGYETPPAPPAYIYPHPWAAGTTRTRLPLGRGRLHGGI